MISEMPCSSSSPKPTGMISLAGQRTRPPALLEISLMRIDSIKYGQETQIMITQSGTRKNAWPNRAIRWLARSERWLATMSMRICSLRRSA